LETWAVPKLSTQHPIIFFGNQPGGAVTLGGETPIELTAYGSLNKLQWVLNFCSSRINIVMVSPDYRTGGIEYLAAVIGHELSHSEDGIFCDSILEETIAYGIQYQVEYALHKSDPNGFNAMCASFGDNPTQKQLEEVKYRLGNGTDPTSRMYNSLPYWPSNSWSTLLGMVSALLLKQSP
jgi:hypothetical protein